MHVCLHSRIYKGLETSRQLGPIGPARAHACSSHPHPQGHMQSARLRTSLVQGST